MMSAGLFFMVLCPLLSRRSAACCRRTWISVIVRDDDVDREVEGLEWYGRNKLAGEAYANERAVKLRDEAVIEAAAASQTVPLRVECHPRNYRQIHLLRGDPLRIVGRLEYSAVSGP